MSIRPVDIQLAIQRAPEVNRTEQGEGRRPDVLHQQFSQIMQKHTDAELHQVLQSNKSELENVDKDGSGKNKYERKKKDKKNSGEKPNKPKPEGTSMFDITV